MIAMLHVTYPADAFKPVVQAFMSPDIPKRPDAFRELSSINFQDASCGHAIFTYEVPDEQVAEFIHIQNKRSVFISTRAPGFNANVTLGQAVGPSIQSLMPLAA
jgi:hypothetical protein